MDSEVKRRPYDGSNRARQARETRRRIVEAAAELFVRDGYAATSIAAIAAEAGVAVPTVYATLRSKAEHPASGRRADRAGRRRRRRRWRRAPPGGSSSARSDPREQLARFARLHREVGDREAAVFAQIEAAAGADPTRPQMLADHDRMRYETQSRLARSLRRRGAAQAGPDRPPRRGRHLDDRQRADLPGARRATGAGRPASYERWVAEQLEAALLPGGPGAGQTTGGGVPSALAASAGSHSQTTHAWRNAERANSSATACGSSLDAHVVPVEDVQAELVVPARGRGRRASRRRSPPARGARRRRRPPRR